jgi:AcrR family transcriptional regulator
MPELSAAHTRTEKKRAQIRAAAKHLFLQQGFGATSTDAIATAASISKETLSRSYANKEELLVDVLRSLPIERPFWVQLTERSPEPKSPQELRGLLRTTAHGLLETRMQPEYLATLRLLLASSPRIPSLGDLFGQTVPAQGCKYFLTLLRVWQRNGVVREHIDPPLVTPMFLATLLTYVLPNGLIRSSQAPRIPDPAALDTFVDHLMEMISTHHT